MDRITLVKELLKVLEPHFIDVIDESHMHGRGGVHTHLRVIVVSQQFVDISRVERQKKIYQLLDGELKKGLHALALRALTPEEWSAQGQKDQFASPDCQHGKAKA